MAQNRRRSTSASWSCQAPVLQTAATPPRQNAWLDREMSPSIVPRCAAVTAAAPSAIHQTSRSSEHEFVELEIASQDRVDQHVLID